MARHTHEVWIDCDPEALFAVLMDPASNRRWQSGVVETHASVAGVAGVGATMVETRELAGCRTTIEYQLVEMDWGRRAVVRLTRGPLRGTASYLCRPVAGGTQLTVASDVTLHGRWRCAGRAVRGLVAAELARSCQRLKHLLEAPALRPSVA